MVTLIKLERVKRGMNQGQLADKARSNKNRIHQIERGMKASPTDMANLATALGTPAGDLFTEDGFPKFAT
jgi:transcriptional regulator with XRE-family HTH domain